MKLKDTDHDIHGLVKGIHEHVRKYLVIKEPERKCTLIYLYILGILKTPFEMSLGFMSNPQSLTAFLHLGLSH